MNIKRVTGNDCLNYIHKPIGFTSNAVYSSQLNIPVGVNDNQNEIANNDDFLATGMHGISTQRIDQIYETVPFNVFRFNHNNNRIIGYVKNRYDDGGENVYILGNDVISVSNQDTNIDYVRLSYSCFFRSVYEYVALPVSHYDRVGQYSIYPSLVPTPSQETGNSIFTFLTNTDYYNLELPFDELLDFNLSEYLKPFSKGQNIGDMFRYANGVSQIRNIISDDIDNTVSYGAGVSKTKQLEAWFYNNCFEYINGNIYEFLIDYNVKMIPLTADSYSDPDQILNFNNILGKTITSSNCHSKIYNLILTDNLEFAKAYLSTGAIPPDAYLYPLDWESLPKYSKSDDDETDGEDDNVTDDNTRDVTPNPPIVPSFTPSMLTNNNYYWLTAPDLEGFMSWYWNDVGSIQDIDDLLAKIEGLYNNLSQAILNIRFMPVDISWIGGLGSDSNIIIAQIEKAGTYNTISKTGKPIVRDIGHITIPNKYNSFVDLSPYSQLSIYLPYHGFIDLDINIFSGHDIYIKAIYDFLSGTIQYLIYYDNQFLVTTLVAKMAVDIPISLQTKNDRDSAVFQNVSNVVGGLMGAGLSIGTGNPMGLLVGANALNSGVASAPLNVKGNVGETGAFYAPPQCAIILRRPTISKPTQDIWKSKVGQICGKSYTLNNLTGFTTVYNPQISFSGNKNADGVTMKPLESEVREIYDYLEKGVIL